MLPMSVLRPGRKEMTAFLTFFVVILISTSTKTTKAQDDQVDLRSTNFQPSLFVVIGVLSIMFALTFLLLVYAKWCHREPPRTHNHDNLDNNRSNRGMFGAHTRFSGLNTEVVESLPFFRFSALKGAKRGLQCSVCLTEFEDIEILRLLPKCKHGFHIECIDQWLESHSTCPLCRQKVTSEDLSMLVNSSSMRLIMQGKSNFGDTSSNFEVFVEREDDQRSSRFSIGGSFRSMISSSKKEEIVEACSDLHAVNHRIVVSDCVFKNRWSDVKSSDLMFLNSEMLGFTSSDRLSSAQVEGCNNNIHHSVVNIREEMERKRTFEEKIGKFTKNNSENNNTGVDNSRHISSTSVDKRAMSEITGVSRFNNLMKTNDFKEYDDEFNSENFREELNRRKKWFDIAKKTVEWFANRENNRFLQASIDAEKIEFR